MTALVLPRPHIWVPRLPKLWRPKPLQMAGKLGLTGLLHSKLLRPSAVGGAAAAAANPKLIQIITDASLTTNLELVLDSGSSTSYDGSSQSWLDETANSFDFFLGTTSGADATDPTFNGSSGGLSSADYFSVDGGDYFTYDTTNETWMQNLHKDNAVFSAMSLFYPVGTSGQLFGTNGGTTTGVSLRGLGGSPPRFTVLNAGGVVFDVTATTNIAADAWHMVAISITEGGSSFIYQDGAYNQVAAADTFTATYDTPASGDATYTLQLGTRGNASAPFDSGSRFACFAFWEGTALTKANFDTIWDSIRTRFSI